MNSAARPVVFDHVTKGFRKGSAQGSLRDAITGLFGRSAAVSQEFLALDDVSFDVAQGEALGVIGPNGSGKSTTLKLLTGILVPDRGRVRVDGRVAPLIEVGAGFHPDLTGRENIHLNAAISGMSKGDIRQHFDAIVAFSGIESFLDTPVKRYSSGMYMRLGFSIAAHIPSEVLLVDEVLAVGDVGFRARCIERMQQLKREGRTILFVSHSTYQVRSLCDRVVYLVNGKKEFDGDVVEGTRRYEQDVMKGAVGERAATGKSAGDAPVAIQEARLCRDAGDEGVIIAPGDPLEVLVRYRLERAMPSAPVLSLALLRGDGVTACVLNTREQGLALDASPGVHTVRARFDSIPLVPGKFSVETLLWDAEMVVVLDQITAGGFEVRSEDRKPINRPGVFTPQGSFTRGEG
ncbi:MAG: ABC transporter ATP-binding protein [Planctomycetes bacterium]|nr:ABC transporter ATP-binding protein [Planctomycetota bacterium]